MEVLLITDVEKLGFCGDTVSVKSGYARNYLMPMGLAVVPTPHALLQIENKRKAEAEKRESEAAAAEAAAKKLEGLSVTVQAQADEHDGLYGAVSAHMIVEQLQEEHGQEVSADKIVIAEPIKALGTFSVNIKLGRSATVALKVWVVKADAEAPAEDTEDDAEQAAE